MNGKLIKITIKNNYKKRKRINEIHKALFFLEYEIKNNENFRMWKFIRESRLDCAIIQGFHKLGFYEINGTKRKPTYKWLTNSPSRKDAKLIVDFLNQKAKEYCMLRK